MSRIGKQPIELGKDVKIELKGQTITAQGPKGKISFTYHPLVKVTKKDTALIVERVNDEKLARSLHGTVRAIISNMVNGVVNGYKKELEIIGVGYKAQLQGKKLTLRIGLSHPIEIPVPDDLKVQVAGNNKIIVEGIDKTRVGQFAANIRKLYPPEPYKGKGIRYTGEVVRKKLGKAMAK